MLLFVFILIEEVWVFLAYSIQSFYKDEYFWLKLGIFWFLSYLQLNNLLIILSWEIYLVAPPSLLV